MQIQLGIDSVEIARIGESLRRARFLTRVYSPAERVQLAQKKRPEETAAGYFAAKEAFAKAVGTGLWAFDLREVSVEYEADGRPCLRLSGKAAALAAGRRFALSITHTKTTATAVAAGYEE